MTNNNLSRKLKHQFSLRVNTYFISSICLLIFSVAVLWSITLKMQLVGMLIWLMIDLCIICVHRYIYLDKMDNALIWILFIFIFVSGSFVGPLVTILVSNLSMLLILRGTIIGTTMICYLLSNFYTLIEKTELSFHKDSSICKLIHWAEGKKFLCFACISILVNIVICLIFDTPVSLFVISCVLTCISILGISEYLNSMMVKESTAIAILLRSFLYVQDSLLSPVELSLGCFAKVGSSFFKTDLSNEPAGQHNFPADPEVEEQNQDLDEQDLFSY